MSLEYVGEYIEEASEILKRIDIQAINRVVARLVELRERGGRLFILGVGGGAGNASHAVGSGEKF